MKAEIPRRSERINGPELLEKIDYVLFDVDAILVHTAINAIEKLKEILVQELGPDIDTNFSPFDIERYGQATLWALERGLPKERVANLEMEIWDDSEVLGKADEIEGAIEIVEVLRLDFEKRVGFHTSRPFGSGEYTLSWLLDRLPYVSDTDLDTVDSIDADRHEFKAKNTVDKAKRHGTVLVIEDYPGHARSIRNLAEKEGVDVWVILVPYAKVPVEEDLLKDEKVIVINRNSETQDLWPLFEYFKGKRTP